MSVIDMARSKGEGSVYRLPNGRWRGYITGGYKPDGKRDRRYVTARTKTKALEEFKKLQTKLLTGTLPEPERMTVGQFLDLWLDRVKSSMRPKTWAGYEANVRLHLKPAFGRLPLPKLTPLHIQDLYQRLLDRGRTPRTVEWVHTTLHSALRRAVQWRMITSNPVDAVEVPPWPPRRSTPSPEECARLLEALEADRLRPPCTAPP